MGKGMERGMGVSRSGMGRDRRDGHQNEWKSATNGVGSPGRESGEWESGDGGIGPFLLEK